MIILIFSAINNVITHQRHDENYHNKTKMPAFECAGILLREKGGAPHFFSLHGFGYQPIKNR